MVRQSLNEFKEKGLCGVEPFTITCTSCASRVRVRNPDLLGQLANCPKCNSMILIAPPSAAVSSSAVSEADHTNDRLAQEQRGTPGEPRIEVERHHGPAVDSTALTQEGLPADLTGNAADSEPGSGDEDEYRLTPEPIEAAPSGASMTAPPVLPAASQAGPHASPTWDADGPAHLPSADWTSDSTTKTRQMLLVGFLGFAGVMLAVLLFVAFLRWYTKDNTTLAATNRNATDQVTDNTVSDDTPAGEQPDPSSTTTDLNDAATGDAVVIENASANESPSTQPGELPTTETNASANDADLSAEADSATAMGTTGEAADVSPNADSTVDSSLDSSLADGEQSTPAEATLDLPKRLQSFGPMLQYEIQPQFSDAAEILTEAPVTAEDLGLTTSVDFSRNASHRLGRPIKSNCACTGDRRPAAVAICQSVVELKWHPNWYQPRFASSGWY